MEDLVTQVTGALPSEMFGRSFGRADVGLTPHYSTPHGTVRFLNKLFDYMMLGLPVIVSNARPTARIVEEVGCGEVFAGPKRF